MPPQNINKLNGSFDASLKPNCPIRPIGNASSPGIHLAAFLAFCQYPAPHIAQKTISKPH